MPDVIEPIVVGGLGALTPSFLRHLRATNKSPKTIRTYRDAATQLEILSVAYSGLRWGEHAVLTADRIEPLQRRIVVDRQVIETRHHLALSAPKNRRRRTC